MRIPKQTICDVSLTVVAGVLLGFIMFTCAGQCKPTAKHPFTYHICHQRSFWQRFIHPRER